MLLCNFSYRFNILNGSGNIARTAYQNGFCFGSDQFFDLVGKDVALPARPERFVKEFDFFI